MAWVHKMIENSTSEFLESLNRFGWRLGLDNISYLLNRLNNPQANFPAVHVAGTNGKGSTTAMLESIWRHAGYRTGLYTSPHLMDVTERLKINGEAISGENFCQYLKGIKIPVEELGCTYFETLTAIAFKYFSDKQVEMAFIEVGLGGRFDATNVITPLLSVITNIDLDHTQYLGQSKVEIAREKAGIIKPAVPALSGCTDEVVNSVLYNVAERKNTDLLCLEKVCSTEIHQLAGNHSTATLLFPDEQYNVRIGLAGEHQIWNAALAVQGTRMLRQYGFGVAEHHIGAGLARVACRGRMETIQNSPRIVVDVAHNPAAIKKLIEAVTTIFVYRRLIVLLGLLQDKDFAYIARLVALAADSVVIVAPDAERALKVERLESEIKQHRDDCVLSFSMSDAYEKAMSMSRKDDLICVTGSHYVVGEFLSFYKKS